MERRTEIHGMSGARTLDLSPAAYEADSLPTVAALYVDPHGVYAGLPGVEVWDEKRDARLYAGPWPVVAHPPCKAWSMMGNCRPEIIRGEDGGCFAAALAAVRKFGGVLEHPLYSRAFAYFGLPIPMRDGWNTSLFDTGYSCEVDQAQYGHRANKRTWLYYVGPEPPGLRFDFAPFTGTTVANDGGGGRDQRSRTPPAFRDVLLAMARSAAGAVDE
jgi:hypothetical protein